MLSFMRSVAAVYVGTAGCQSTQPDLSV